jgi:hypothetical protein
MHCSDIKNNILHILSGIWAAQILVQFSGQKRAIVAINPEKV